MSGKGIDRSRTAPGTPTNNGCRAVRSCPCIPRGPVGEPNITRLAPQQRRSEYGSLPGARRTARYRREAVAEQPQSSSEPSGPGGDPTWPPGKSRPERLPLLLTETSTATGSRPATYLAMTRKRDDPVGHLPAGSVGSYTAPPRLSRTRRAVSSSAIALASGSDGPAGPVW